MRNSGQRLSRPSRQGTQRPHERPGLSSTRSPFPAPGIAAVPGPRADTTPHTSPPEVDVVEPDRAHLDLRLTGPWRRHQQLADLQHLGPAVAAEQGGPHRYTDLSLGRAVAVAAASARAPLTTSAAAVRNASMVASDSSPMFAIWMCRS